MLVYGDGAAREPTAAKLAAIREEIAAALARPPGIERHAHLVAALIEAGVLAQAVEDHLFAVRGGIDDRSPTGGLAMNLALALAQLVAESWRSDFRGELRAGTAQAALNELAATALPASLEVRTPEGFLFYCVYPESYLEAAEALRDAGPVTVIGLRSIGATLAALVAATLGGGSPITARPVGHPFARELSLARGLRDEIGRARTVAIVDEGPGLSGSSMLAAHDAAADSGAPSDRIHLLPSHPNPPGAAANEDAQARWRRVPRHVVGFDEAFLHSPRPARRLSTWVADLVGEATVPPDDLSGGAWRRLRCRNQADWPPVVAWGERRKFLWTTAGRRWLVRFEGLGRAGRRRLDRARLLADAGFAPEPAGWRHGFLIEGWVEASPYRPGERWPERALAQAGRYLGFRARAFPAANADRGASLARLFEMALHNVAEGLGPQVAGRLALRRDEAERLSTRVRPVEIDARLQPWEWLRCGDRILKADALHHHAGHDLVGCQDIAYDLAGLGIELGLSTEELESVISRAEDESRIGIDRTLVDFLTPIYLAFRLGVCRMTENSAEIDEGRRLVKAGDGYADTLRSLLEKV